MVLKIIKIKFSPPKSEVSRKDANTDMLVSLVFEIKSR